MLELEARLERIERSLRRAERRAARWKVAAFGALGILGASVCVAFTAQNANDTLRTKRLEIVDENNKVVLLCTAGEKGGQFDIWSNAGRNTMRLASNDQGGELDLWNNSGRIVVGGYATLEGGRLEASRSDGSVAFVAAGMVNGGAVSAKNSAGSEVFFAGSNEKGMGLVKTADSRGAAAAALVANAQGGTVETRNSAGDPAALLGASADGKAGVLQVMGMGAKDVFSVDVREDGSGRLSLGNHMGLRNLVLETGAADAGTVTCLSGGKPVVRFGSGAQGGLLNLLGLDGTSYVVAGSVADGKGGALSVRGSAGQQLVRCGVDMRGNGEIAVYNGAGTDKRVITPE